jgi:hypothetical protein
MHRRRQRAPSRRDHVRRSENATTSSSTTADTGRFKVNHRGFTGAIQGASEPRERVEIEGHSAAREDHRLPRREISQQERQASHRDMHDLSVLFRRAVFRGHHWRAVCARQ